MAATNTGQQVHTPTYEPASTISSTHNQGTASADSTAPIGSTSSNQPNIDRSAASTTSTTVLASQLKSVIAATRGLRGFPRADLLEGLHKARDGINDIAFVLESDDEAALIYQTCVEAGSQLTRFIRHVERISSVTIDLDVAIKFLCAFIIPLRMIRRLARAGSIPFGDREKLLSLESEMLDVAFTLGTWIEQHKSILQL